MKRKPYSYNQWLKKPLIQLQLSAAFITAVTIHGFKTLQEIIKFPLKELVKTKWFTGSLLIELSLITDKYREKIRADNAKKLLKKKAEHVKH